MSRLLLGIALIAVGALGASIGSAQHTATSAPRAVPVVAKRFAFEPSEIDAAVGERLQLVVTSGDGVHGIEIKKFNVKREIPRGGAPVVIEFTPAEEGRFPILCSEYCGDGHDEMRGALIVRAR